MLNYINLFGYFNEQLTVSGASGTLENALRSVEEDIKLAIVKRSKKNFLVESHVKDKLDWRKNAMHKSVMVIHNHHSAKSIH